MRLKFLLITLCLISATTLLYADTEKNNVAESFCKAIRGQNIANHSFGDKIRNFFKNDTLLSDYIVTLYYTWKKNKIRDFTILDCSIINIKETSNSSLRVEYKITGNGWLFFHKNIIITNNWQKENDD